MKLSHHIRAYMLKRQADALLRRASRLHKQSKHMIGRTKFATGPEALVNAAVAAAPVLTEPVQPDFEERVQVANQK